MSKRSAIMRTPLSVPNALQELWFGACTLEEGEEMEIPFPSRDEAARAQRWAFRERKRAKARMLEQLSASGEPFDPDSADVWRGLVTALRGDALVIRRPVMPKFAVIRSPGKKPRRISLG